MSSHLADLVARRESLVARSTRYRADFGDQVRNLRGEIALVEVVFRVARRLRRSGPALGALAAALLFVGPKRILRAMSTAVRFAPYAIDAYEFARSVRDRVQSPESAKPLP